MCDTVGVDATSQGDSCGPWSAEARSRLSRISYNGLRVRVAISDNDFNVVAELRARGFGRLLKDAAGYSWLGESDYSKNTRVLIVETLESTVLGTMRIQDGRHNTRRTGLYSPAGNSRR
jgi:hypothetical protein